MQTAFGADQTLQILITVLADGKFHSGQELGEVLGVSRAAVWKQLQKLEPLGIRLSSVKGKGYCLEGGLNLLSAPAIESQLNPVAQQLLTRLELCPVVDSTNAQAMRSGLEWGSGYACLAEFQTAGRGRRGRTWVSPFGKNIYLSLMWTFDGGAAELEGLSLAVGVAIADGLAMLGVEKLELKWPNDVLWQGKKLAGILLEMTGDPAGVCQVVIGIGVNVLMPAEAASEIDQPWIDLSSVGRFLNLPRGNIERNRLVAALLSQLLPLLQSYKKDRFVAYRHRWEALNAYAGQKVQVHMANKSVDGEMLGVGETGALRLKTVAGEELFYGGEVSLRLTA